MQLTQPVYCAFLRSRHQANLRMSAVEERCKLKNVYCESAVSWVMTPCSLVNIYRSLGVVGHAAPYQATGPIPTPSSPINQSTHNMQPANSCKSTQHTPKTASVVYLEDGRLTPETCRRLTPLAPEFSFKFQHTLYLKCE
jgi:hypothetical protein